MEEIDLFKLLENQFLTYKELAGRSVQENGEKLVPLSDTDIHFTCLDYGVKPSTGAHIYVREGLVSLLEKAQRQLDEIMPEYQIDVVYGYRSPKIQKESYLQIREEILAKSTSSLSEEELMEEIHHFIAVPDVAGHPTGGAVDVRLIHKKTGKELDMGTPAHTFTKESYVFYPLLGKDVWRNRQKLRQVMLAVGFAPFDGEWWHFSYGDKEWATYYNKPFALYNQIDLDAA